MPKRIIQGVVLSTKMQKTIVIAVERRYLHPVMQKVVRRTKHFKVHDEHNVAKVGNLVWARECRPISKTKTWELVNDGDVAADSKGGDNTAGKTKSVKKNK
ncbi:MAG: 30S ribosomal protein S17 [Alphaproteobacteria bacterium]|nr:30S ribosomal protein S17 [Alphaproteobacteria bacterium]